MIRHQRPYAAAVRERPDDRSEAALAVSGLSKTFLGTVALKDVSLTVGSGSVHGLLGENGSGKSTLIKVLAGYHSPDPGGLMQLFGRPVGLPIAQGSHHQLGMSFVHQDLGLTPELSVAENLLVREVTDSTSLKLDWRSVRNRAADILSTHGLAVRPRRLVGSLSKSQQSMLAIIRGIEELSGAARGGRPGLLVLDEPSGALSAEQKRWMYDVIRAFVARSGSVLIISHDNEEILELTDEVTILRDGAVVQTLRTAETTHEELTEAIVGRPLSTVDRHSSATPTPLARIEGLAGGQVHDVTLTPRSGEILGLTGLLGSGFEEVLPLLFGAAPAAAGRLYLAGKTADVREMTPQTAMSMGVGFVPENRVVEGCVGELSINDNMTLCVLGRYRSLLGLSRSRMWRDASGSVSTYGVKAPHALVPVKSLSGGNQQKVLIAKWLQTRPSLLLLQEPTVGLDIGARFDIFTTLREYVAGGATIICASSDWEQLALLCDRVAIFGRGRLVSHLANTVLTESMIGHACYEAARQSKVAQAAEELMSHEN